MPFTSDKMRIIFTTTLIFLGILIFITDVFGVLAQRLELRQENDTKTICMETILHNRRESLRNRCLLYPRLPHNSFTVKNLIFSRAQNFAWCPIYKAGSTNWMWQMAFMSQKYDQKLWNILKQKMHISKYVKHLYDDFSNPLEKFQDLQGAKKLIIVRHPFERLLSAYRDKLEKPTRKYYHRIYGNHISKGYREAFGENHKRNTPTFTQFLKYIVNEKNFNEHWQPYTVACDPCNIDYDYIIKVETLRTEQEYVLKTLNISRIYPLVKRFEDKNLYNINPDGRTDTNLSCEYFSKVPNNLLKSLYKIFEQDFVLFQYSQESYCNLTLAS